MCTMLKFIWLLSFGCSSTLMNAETHCKSKSVFGIRFNDKAYSGSMLEDVTSKTETECRLMCTSMPMCKSINYRETDERCQLIGGNTDTSVEFLTDKPGWTFISANDEEKIQREYSYKKAEGKLHYDCDSVYDSGSTQDGVYKISVNGSGHSLSVFCDMTSKNTGWIVIQRRVSDDTDFYRGWQQYKTGFGNLTRNMWIGLENLHILAGPGKNATLRVEMRHFSDPTKVYFAEYTTFIIGNETEKYRLTIGGYSGNAGNSMSLHNGMKFSTMDNDNDMVATESCAVDYRGAWWYARCHYVNLNGLFPNSYQTSPIYMSWHDIKGSYGNIIFSEMKIRYP